MSTICEKENETVTPKLNNRKSYSILGPISNTAPTTPTRKSGGHRIISESTGLVKFSLSPNKLQKNTSGITTPDSSPIKSGLPVYVPVRAVKEVISEDNGLKYDEILEKYLSKQKELAEYEKKVELVKFELLELSTQLEKSKIEPKHTQNNINKTNGKENHNDDYINILRKKASNIFVLDQHKNIKKKASSIFQNTSPIKRNSINNISAYINKFQDQLSNNLNEMTIKEDVKNFINKQSNDLDEFTFKTTKIVNGLFNNISEKKNTDKIIHTSYNFDNLESKELINKKSFLPKEVNEENEDSVLSMSTDIIDIDDYDEDSDY